MSTIIAGHKTRLRGDLKYEGILNDYAAADFLVELEALLHKYHISKIDICWAPEWAEAPGNLGINLGGEKSAN